MTKRRKKQKNKGWFAFRKRDGKKKTKPAARKTKKRKTKNAPRISPLMRVLLTIVGFAVLIAGLTAGFMVAEQYIQTLPQIESHTGPLKLIHPPRWLGQAWVDHIIDTVGGSRFPLDDTAAQTVGPPLATIAWMVDVNVQTTPQHIEVRAQYRRPIVRIRHGGRGYYVDEQMVVFEALPVTQIAIPEVVGFTQRSVPSPGTVWLAEDIKAAMELVRVLGRMDVRMAEVDEPIEKPLLDEIAAVDVSNFAGRRNGARPHLVLNVKDSSTQVYWGAAWGQAARQMEANEKDKLTTLYQFYIENNNTLKDSVRFIDLTRPKAIPRP